MVPLLNVNYPFYGKRGLRVQTPKRKCVKLDEPQYLANIKLRDFLKLKTKSVTNLRERKLKTAN